MLKIVLQISLITFFLVLCYDTIDLCLNQINSKNENELLIVKREIEDTTTQVESTTSYETYDFPIWPIALGFSSAFCFVVGHFLLPLKTSLVKRELIKENENHSRSKLNKRKRYYKQDIDEFSYYEGTEKKDSSIQLFDKRIKDELQYHSDLGFISCQDSSSPENEINNYHLAQLNEGAQEKSILDVCFPNLSHEMFPAQSSLNVINSVSLSSSKTSLEHLDWGNSKNVYSMLLENKSISKMGLPVVHSFYGEENNSRKHFSNNLFEKNSEILTINNAIFEENVSQRSEDSSDSMTIKQGQIVGLFSMLSNEASKSKTATSDKSINVQLLTYTDNDIKDIEKRLENVEYGLRRSEEKTKDWGNRINSAETELVDLHEQMYTIFSKFEEEKKSNYIIVSKVSKDKILPKEKDEFDTLGEESEEFDQVDEKEGKDENIRNKEEVASIPNPESAVLEKDLSDEQSEADDQSAIDKSCSEDDEDDQKSIEKYDEVILKELKQRSIALETLLESKSRSQINTRLPKKKIPQLNVPRHVLPPYKRSSFAGTDSKAELRKKKLNFIMPCGGKEFYWRNRI